MCTHVRREHRPEQMVGHGVLEHPLARDLVGQRLREQVLEVQHLDAAITQHVGKGVVLLPGALHPQHVVEQQVGAVRRRQPLELEIGTVQHHLPQPPHLGIDTERHGVRLLGYQAQAGREQVTSTGHGAWCTTAIVVLPSAMRESPVRPCEHIADHRGRKILR